jgi:hypothetical protein
VDSTSVAISPEQAAEIGAVSLTSFGKLFFPRTFRQESPPFHEDVGRALFSSARFNAFEVFRGGAKTTLLRVYKAQRISYGLSRTIMYVSVSQPHSMMSVRWLRRHIEFNRRWSLTFGLEKGIKWTDEHCEIIHRNMPLNEDGSPVLITVLAMGITGQVRGFNPDDFRPDLIILDDVLNEENTATPEQRQKTENLIFGAVLNSLAPATEAPLAKAAFLQTPFNKEDSIEKCMKDPEWNPVKYGCLEYSDRHPEGASRWETRYPTEQLLKAKAAHIARSQYRLWMREWECQLVSGEEKALDISKWKFYDVLPESLDTIISLDPASSDSPKADEFATVALGFKGLDVYILDYTAAKAVMPDKAANDTFNLILLYGPRKIVVEAVSYQRVMAWFLEQEMIRRRIFVAVEALQVKKASNADRIMQTIPGLAAFGHFWCRPHHSKLLQQADDYDPQVKDAADDLLTAIANGIISWNPGIRAALTDPETGLLVDDESEYEPLTLRGAP